MAAAVLLGAGPAPASTTPNDPYFSLQWGDQNSGQAIPLQFPAHETLEASVKGTPGADDGASSAWSLTTGSASIVIGQVDTGVDYEHPDLAKNIWTNPTGIGACKSGEPGCLNGKCAPGTRGYEVISESCQPLDMDTSYGGHGTHVAGIMGAVGDNGIGVAGINWHTTILPVKWLGSAEEEGAGSASRLAAALEWLAQARNEGVNVRVVNDSPTYVATKPTAQLREAIERLGREGILFVAAAGNDDDNENVVSERTYPCGFDLANEICVTATDNRDQMPRWDNYGSEYVQLAAPGVSIYSTLRGAGSEERYGYLSGTSMAAAQVSGAAALILSRNESMSVSELKNDILTNVDPLPSLQGKVSSGGRLDVCKAIPGCSVAPVIRALGLSPDAFSAASSGPAISAKSAPNTGTTVRYSDSQASLVRFTVLAAHSGVRAHSGSCVAAPAHGKVHGKRCVRYVAIARFTRSDRSGANRFHFSGHVGRLRLAAGRYLLQALPFFDGRYGNSAAAGFRIV